MNPINMIIHTNNKKTNYSWIQSNWKSTLENVKNIQPISTTDSLTIIGNSEHQYYCACYVPTKCIYAFPSGGTGNGKILKINTLNDSVSYIETQYDISSTSYIGCTFIQSTNRILAVTNNNMYLSLNIYTDEFHTILNNIKTNAPNISSSNNVYNIPDNINNNYFYLGVGKNLYRINKESYSETLLSSGFHSNAMCYDKDGILYLGGNISNSYVYKLNTLDLSYNSIKIQDSVINSTIVKYLPNHTLFVTGGPSTQYTIYNLSSNIGTSQFSNNVRNSYGGAILAHNGFVYIGCNGSIQKYNYITNTFTLVSSVSGQHKRFVISENGYLYGIPMTGTSIIKIDIKTQITNEKKAFLSEYIN